MIKTRGHMLHKQFLDFHKAHPEVYKTLVRLTREWIAKYRGRGCERLGIGMIYEVARWEIIMASCSDGDTLQMNNNHRSFYARLMMYQEPDLRSVFKTRALRSYCPIPY